MDIAQRGNLAEPEDGPARGKSISPTAPAVASMPKGMDRVIDQNNPEMAGDRTESGLRQIPMRMKSRNQSGQQLCVLCSHRRRVMLELLGCVLESGGG
jgi:hypothetical protein